MKEKSVVKYLRFSKYTVSRAIVIWILLMSVMGVVNAQDNAMLRGTVRDTQGNSLPGVNIIIKGTTTGTVSDVNGQFNMNVQFNDIIVFNFIGFENYEIKYTGQSPLNIVLEEDIQGLEEVLVIGYGTQKKISVTGAVGSVKSEELLKSPVPSIANALAGRTAGVTTVQRSGEPGKDNANIYIRGVATFASDASAQPMVLVDGIERNYNSIDPNEIETINILKDASSTAVFGVRGANGVIIITTKTGKVGKPSVNFTSNFGLQNPIRLPKLLDGVEWATLRNMAAVNDGSPEPFSQEDLELFRNGNDPAFHPNIDWMDYMIKDYIPQQQYNVNVSGGSKDARYFVSLGYLNQEGAYKMGDFFKDFSANPNYERYNIRTNFDINWSDDFSTSIKAGVQIMKGNYAKSSSSSVLNTIFSANPIMSPVVYDDKMIRNVDGLTAWQISNTPLYEMLSFGYDSNFGSNLNLDVSANYKLDRLITGLSVRTKVAYDSYYQQKVSRTKGIPMYDLKYNPNAQNFSDSIVPVITVNQVESPIRFDKEEYDKTSKTYGEAAIEYNRTIAGNTVSALLLGTVERFYNGKDELPFNYMGLVARTTYNYYNKYLIELNMGYNGSENFAKGKQFGFFPSFSLGYVLSEESFFPKNSILTFLKLRGSVGKVGNDKAIIGSTNYRFIFTPSAFEIGNEYFFGSNHDKYTGYTESTLGNPDVTWETAIKSNVGLDFKFFKDRVSLSADYFKEERNNILWRLNIPVTFGQPDLVAPYNIGQAENYGYELELGFADKLDSWGLSYWINGNYSFARNKIVYMDETPQPYPGLVKTGSRINQPKGLLADGFYNTMEEINDPERPISEWEGAGLQPGDIRYVDVNDDGFINDNDYVNIGNPNIPEVMYGVSFGLAWKGIEASVLFQGATNVSTYIAGSGAWPFIAGTKTAFDSSWESWTPDRYEQGLPISLPRLTASPEASKHNYRTSSFWQEDASYIRLKNLEVGYSFDPAGIKKIGVKSLRIFLSGQNLHTWTKMKYFDPEMAANQNGAAYPLMRVYNLGVNLKF